MELLYNYLKKSNNLKNIDDLIERIKYFYEFCLNKLHEQEKGGNKVEFLYNFCEDLFGIINLTKYITGIKMREEYKDYWAFHTNIKKHILHAVVSKLDYKPKKVWLSYD